jgi:surfactin synthase thioesterase subunit
MKPTLWCFPFAGASYYSYRPIFKSIEQSFTVKYLELPGRGNRMNQPLLYNYQEVLNDIFFQVKEEIQEPFIFFGHSMGAQLAFDTAHLLLSQYNLKPLKLIVSGRGAPSVVKMKKRYDLPNPEFKNALQNLGGIPREILNDPEFFSFFEPILRADFKAIENYKYEKKPPLDIPILTLIGDKEETTIAEASAWNEETTGKFNLKIFKGGHFFILEHTQQIIELILEKTC